ncbi:pyrimidine 5'-nucleotidase [Sphingorhabdus arenilitoris]|uniref:Pyrimidine 5'-nucleotidase n=1 Tax=Sphingorhabdus arenilitoris TaxID=1490041 RepID=A0ABV8RIH2_9SPHN
MTAALHQIDNWIFDLDNTLYPVSSGLHKLMDMRIRAFVGRTLGLDDDAAHRVQKDYFRNYGTTLSGLMAEHGTDPYEYLADVHDFSLSAIDDAPRLAEHLSALPGRKVIFTNADAPYAARVLDRLGLEGIFEQIIDIHTISYEPKPAQSAYDTLLEKTGIDPARSIFFEDMARNLLPAKKMGMQTVWIDSGWHESTWGHDGGGDDRFAHVDYRIDSLAGWLESAIETLQISAL